MKKQILFTILLTMFLCFVSYTNVKSNPDFFQGPSVPSSYIGYEYTSDWDRKETKTHPKTAADFFMGGKLTKKE